MSELHYEQSQRPQKDDPSIEYHMRYPQKSRWTPSIEKWFNKKYCDPKNYRTEYFQYIKAEKVECPF